MIIKTTGTVVKHKGRYAFKFPKGETEKYGLKIGDSIRILKIYKVPAKPDKVAISLKTHGK